MIDKLRNRGAGPASRPFRRGGLVSLVVAVALAVGACGALSPSKEPPPCPPILVLKDAATLTRFVPGPGRDITDVSFNGKIADFRAECKFKKDLSEVSIHMEVVFNFTRGAGNRDRKVSFDYFVAVPFFHPRPEGKKIFAKAGEFQGNRSRLGMIEEVDLSIPLARGTKRSDYEIFLGFQLTQEEVERNRTGNQF